jgi:plastocyanin
MIAIRMRRASLAAVVALALAAPVFSTPGRAADANAVIIDDFKFAPATLTVPAGAKVTWVNRDGEPHTVMSADGGLTFKSPALDTDDSFSFTFAKPGTYTYFCSVHPHMTGTIVVK